MALLIKGTGLKSTSGVGGKPIEDQAFALRQGVDILIGTPGRLQDLIESRYLVRAVVLCCVFVWPPSLI